MLYYLLIRIGLLIFSLGTSIFIYKSYYANTIGNTHHSGDVGDVSFLLILIYICFSFVIASIFEMIYFSILKKESLIFFLTILIFLLLIGYSFKP